jgi:hypothetical protein
MKYICPKPLFHVDDFAVINQKGPQDAAKKTQQTIAQKLSLRRIGDVKLIPALHLKAMCDRTASKICIRQVKTPMLPRSCQNTTVKYFENSCLEILVSTQKISHYIACKILLWPRRRFASLASNNFRWRRKNASKNFKRVDSKWQNWSTTRAAAQSQPPTEWSFQWDFFSKEARKLLSSCTVFLVRWRSLEKEL